LVSAFFLCFLLHLFLSLLHSSFYLLVSLSSLLAAREEWRGEQHGVSVMGIEARGCWVAISGRARAGAAVANQERRRGMAATESDRW
jgi:hypothetical protein